VLALAGLAAETTLSLERVAAVIGLAAQNHLFQTSFAPASEPATGTVLGRGAAALFSQLAANATALP